MVDYLLTDHERRAASKVTGKKYTKKDLVDDSPEIIRLGEIVKFNELQAWNERSCGGRYTDSFLELLSHLPVMREPDGKYHIHLRVKSI